MKRLILTVLFIFTFTLAGVCEPYIPDAVKNVFSYNNCTYYYVTDWKKYEVYYQYCKPPLNNSDITLCIGHEPIFILYNPKTDKARILGKKKTKEYDEATKTFMHRGRFKTYPERPHQQSTD